VWDNFKMIGVLTGAFSGVACALVAALVVFAASRGRRFDFWILIAGAVFGVFWVALNANTYFMWQEWVLTIAVLTLFEYGAPLVKRKMEGQVSVDRSNVLMWVFIVGCVVFVEWFVIAFFMWFYPMVGDRILFYELNADGVEVFRWCALTMPQMERDTIAAYLIFALPAACVIAGSPLALAISNFRNKRRRGQ
jgi:hypothetical protein